MSMLAAPVAYLGPGLRGRLTAGAGAALGVLGVLVWSAGLALVPAAGVAGDAVERTGMMFDAQVDTGRLFRHELLDARLIGILVAVVGLVLVVAGRPSVAGRRPVLAIAAVVALLLAGNALWTGLPGSPMIVTATGAVLAVVAALAVVRSLPGGRPDGWTASGVPPWVPLVAIGMVSGLGYAPSDSPTFRPFVSDAHVLTVFGARELVLLAAVVAACAVGTRWAGPRAIAGAAVVGVGTVAYLLVPLDLLPDLLGTTLVGLAGVAVLALVWSGSATPWAAYGRPAAGAAVAGLIGSVGIILIAVPGMLLSELILPLAATSNDLTGPITFGCGIVHGLVLVGVHRVTGRLPLAR